MPYSRKNLIQRNCLMCGKEFFAKPSEVARGWGKFCSVGCSVSHVQKLNSTKNGNSRSATRRRAREAYIKHFGLPSCQHCGKFPADVHHLDEDPTNNSKENLTCLCRSCHIAYHNHVSPKRKRHAA